ncbi:MAG: DUF3365 domain-containing protein [Methylomarinum sp.]|nr:DUF3365 domain-containing protein [Methylomarinum sp.]
MIKAKYTMLLGSLLAAALPINVSAEITAQTMADAIHDVIEADRAVYADLVVNRLAIEEEVIEASEEYHENSALPLPAQMLRTSAEKVRDKKSGFSFSLVSPWPINSQNKVKTDAEIKGMNAILKSPAKNVYSEETLAGKKYFTALYPDIAVSNSCVSCHNNHKDSPKKDFKVNDVMGGIMIRIPLSN